MGMGSENISLLLVLILLLLSSTVNSITDGCCLGTDYSANYLNCQNAADFTTPITSCSTCVAYQCIDWTYGSNANRAREASFLAETGQKVYFGVGTYSYNQEAGGLCYRITTNALDRDLIVQIINYGGDVPSGNVDLQVGDGGFGLYNACVAPDTEMPQFSGSAEVWGVGFFEIVGEIVT